MTNKAERQRIKMVKYKHRLSNLNIIDDESSNLYCYRNSGQPCSCSLCADDKFRDHRAKEKRNYLKQNGL